MWTGGGDVPHISSVVAEICSPLMMIALWIELIIWPAWLNSNSTSWTYLLRTDHKYLISLTTKMINCPLMRNEWVLVVGDDDDAGQDKYIVQSIYLIVTYSSLWVTLSLPVHGWPSWTWLIIVIIVIIICPRTNADWDHPWPQQQAKRYEKRLSRINTGVLRCGCKKGKIRRGRLSLN